MQVNKHIPVEILNAEWCLTAKQEWPNSVLAHEMEQQVFKILDALRSEGERLTCERDALLAAWEEARRVVQSMAATAVY